MTVSYSSYLSFAPAGTVPLDCEGMRQHRTDRVRVLGGGVSYERGRQRLTVELRRTRGADISGYDCCQLRNDVTTVLVGVSRQLWTRGVR